MRHKSNVDILLISPDYRWHLNPPLGLAYIASYLERCGYSAAILDLATLNLKRTEIMRHLEKVNPKMIGITFTTSQFDQVKTLSRMVRQLSKDIPVVVGGPHASAIPEDVLASIQTVDFVVYGEGEMTTKELLDVYLGGGDLSVVDGLAYREGDRVKINRPRRLIEDLDSLPFPAWHLLDMDRYSPAKTGGCAI